MNRTRSTKTEARPIVVQNGSGEVAAEVFAAVHGEWAFHRKFDFATGATDAEYWTVIHLPTSGAVIDFVDEDTARRVTEALAENVPHLPKDRNEHGPFNRPVIETIRGAVAGVDFTDALIGEIALVSVPQQLAYALTIATAYGMQTTNWTRVWSVVRRRWGISVMFAFQNAQKQMSESIERALQ